MSVASTDISKINGNGIYLNTETNKITIFKDNYISNGDLNIISNNDINNPRYPEYYLTDEQKRNIKYAPKLHLWPIAWYGGEVENVTIEDQSYNGSVFAPGECMYNPHQLEEAMINNNNVKLDIVKNIFVLEIPVTVNNLTVLKYYKNWHNAKEYNNADATGPIPFKLFVKNIYREYNDENGNGLGADSGAAGKWYKWYEPTWGGDANRPVTKYWNNSKWVNPYEGLTNFKNAFINCANNNNGNITLSPNKVYYYEFNGHGSVESINITNKSNFIIEGNNSCVLLRNTYTGIRTAGHSQQFITFKKCNNGIMRNISIVSVRDNIVGTPSMSTEPRFCCTGSTLSLLHIYEQNKNLRFENIYTFGMDHDIYIKSTTSYAKYSSRNIFFHNIKSELTGGNTIRDVQDVVIDGYDLLQDGYSNGGEHVIYFQDVIGVAILRNSIIRATAPYRQSMISWSGGSDSTKSLQELVFENCDISSTCFGGGAYTRTKLKMVNCTIKAISEYSAGQTQALTRNDFLVELNNGDCDLINCTIVVPKYFAHSKSTVTWNILNIDGCRFIRCPKDDGTLISLESIPFFQYFKGKYTVKNTKTWKVSLDESAIAPTRNQSEEELIQNLGFTNATNISDSINIEKLNNSTGFVLMPKYFSSDDPSTNPNNVISTGDYWYETGVRLKKYNGEDWVNVDTNGNEIRLIYDDSNSQLYLCKGGVIHKKVDLINI